MEPVIVTPNDENTVAFAELPDSALLPAIDPARDGIAKARFYRKDSQEGAETLTDTEVGDKAFRNPPGDLDGNEQESVRDAIGASDQRLDDNEIGDAAFRNVPTDLSPSEQESVREAIGAGHDSQSLSDSEIGDKAFSNPPSDLNDNEKEAARNAIGASDQNLTDTKIGETAFDNVPSDLTSSEKKVVRDAIGAGVPLPSTTGKVGRVLSVGSNRVAFWDMALDIILRALGDVSGKGGDVLALNSAEDAIELKALVTGLSELESRHLFSSIKQLQDVTKDIIRGRVIDDFVVVNDPAELGLAIDSAANPDGDYDESATPPAGKLEKLRPEDSWPNGNTARVVIKLIKSEDRNDWAIRITPYNTRISRVIDVPASLWVPISASNGDDNYNYFSLNYFRDYGSGIGRDVTRIEGVTRSLPTTWAGQIAKGIIHDEHLDSALRGKVGKIPEQPARFVQKIYNRLAPTASGVRVGASDNFAIDTNKLYQIAFLETSPQVNNRDYLGSFNQVMSGSVVASLGTKDVGLQHFDRRDSSLGISLYTNGDNHLFIGQQGTSRNPLGDHDVYVFEWE